MTDEPDLSRLHITVSLDGDEQPTFRPAEASPALASALRVQSHGAWRLPVLMAAVFEGDPPGSLCGPEEIAGLVFCGRRQAGELVTYDAVCAQVDAARHAEARFDLEGVAGDEVIDDPPA